MSKGRWWGLGAVTMSVLFAACSDAGKDAGGAGTKGRGTPACNEWQSAYCGLAARCQAVGDVCGHVKGVVCKSDPDALQCAKAMSAVSCAVPPAGCDIRDIADLAPAKKACEAYVSATCAKNESCQPGSEDRCLTMVKSTLDCAKVVAVTLAYEVCMKELAEVTCANPNVPPSCKGVLLQ